MDTYDAYVMISDVPSAASDGASLRDELRRCQEESEQLKVRLRESDHRIKNGLHMIASLVEIEARGYAANECLADFSLGVSRRLRAIACVHDLLSRSLHGIVDLSVILKELCEATSAIIDGPNAPRIELRSVKHEVFAHQASVVALIVNELLTNALKHGHWPPSGGALTVSVEPSDSTLKISVADNAGGLPPRLDVTTSGMGSKLISALARSIGTQCEAEATAVGTTFMLYVPAPRVGAA